MKTIVKLETQMKDHGEKTNKTEGLEKIDQAVDIKSIDSTLKAQIEVETSINRVADNPSEKVMVIHTEIEIPTETEEMKVYLETDETIPPETEETTPPETEETLQEMEKDPTVETEEQHQPR